MHLDPDVTFVVGDGHQFLKRQIRPGCRYTLPRYAQSPPLLIVHRVPRHDHHNSQLLTSDIHAIHWRAHVSTLAGDGSPAGLSDPFGIAISRDGAIYVADAGESNAIRKLTTEGTLITLAGGDAPSTHPPDWPSTRR